MKRIGFVIAAVATGIILILGGAWVYATYLVADAPEEFALPEPTASATAPGPEETRSSIELDGAWVVESGVGGYRVQEVLSGVDNTVAGRTEEVSGSLTVVGGVLTSGEIVVSLGDVETDSSARDTFFQGQLEIGEFPNAIFSFDAGVDVSGLNAGDISVSVPGQMTLHGVTLDEVAQIEARRDGDVIVVVGIINVDYTRYGVPAPNLGFAVVEPDGVIEVQLNFEPLVS